MVWRRFLGENLVGISYFISPSCPFIQFFAISYHTSHFTCFPTFILLWYPTPFSDPASQTFLRGQELKSRITLDHLLIQWSLISPQYPAQFHSNEHSSTLILHRLTGTAILRHNELYLTYTLLFRTYRSTSINVIIIYCSNSFIWRSWVSFCHWISLPRVVCQYISMPAQWICMRTAFVPVPISP